MGACDFVGDSAHQVSPFGARGANSGVEDAENLAWKLAAVLRRRGGRKPDRQLRSRAHAGRRREYRALDPLDRFHRAAFAGGAHACAMRCCRWRRTRTSPAGWSIPDVCRSRPFTTRRYRRPDEEEFGGSRASSARRRRMRSMQTPDRRRLSSCLERLPARFELLYVADGAAPAVPSGIELTVIGRDLIDARGDFARTLRCGARHRLSAAAGPACLRALAQADAGKDRGRARPRARAQSGVRSACAVMTAFRCRRCAMRAGLGADFAMLVGLRMASDIPRRRRGRTRCRWSTALPAAAGDRPCWRAT